MKNIPHYVKIPEDVIQGEKERTFLCTVRGRLMVCETCRQNTHFSSVCPTKANLEKFQKEKRKTKIANLKRNEEIKIQQKKNLAQKKLFP